MPPEYRPPERETRIAERIIIGMTIVFIVYAILEGPFR